VTYILYDCTAERRVIGAACKASYWQCRSYMTDLMAIGRQSGRVHHHYVIRPL
jgi:hypothetical protein